MKYHYILSGMSIIKRLTIPSAGEDMENLELALLVGI